MNLFIRKTNPSLLCFNETAGKLAKIRQGVRYFMRDATFGTNSLAKYSQNMFNLMHISRRDIEKEEEEITISLIVFE